MTRDHGIVSRCRIVAFYSSHGVAASRIEMLEERWALKLEQETGLFSVFVQSLLEVLR